MRQSAERKRNNKAWIKTEILNGKAFNLLEPPKNPNRPAHLPKSYQYELSYSAYRKFLTSIQRIIKPFEKRAQVCQINTKDLPHGVLLAVFFLGKQPGLYNVLSFGVGISREEWDDLTLKLEQAVQAALPGLQCFIEPWRKTKPFRFRLHALVSIPPTKLFGSRRTTKPKS